MGKYDSSKYRITPLLELISSSSQHFEKFTNALGIHGLALPYCFYYGKNEKQLKPTKEHLSRLIDYIAATDLIFQIPLVVNCVSVLLKNGRKHEQRQNDFLSSSTTSSCPPLAVGLSLRDSQIRIYTQKATIIFYLAKVSGRSRILQPKLQTCEPKTVNTAVRWYAIFKQHEM